MKTRSDNFYWPFCTVQSTLLSVTPMESKDDAHHTWPRNMIGVSWKDRVKTEDSKTNWTMKPVEHTWRKKTSNFV